MELNNTNCSTNGAMMNGTCQSNESIDALRLLVIPIFIISFVGNTATIALISCFKQVKVTDVLVLGLAITDLLATLIPLPMSIYSYLSLMDFPEDSAACDTYATIAQFTRYSSALITTVIAIERYLAVLHPIFYKNKCKPPVFGLILVLCWAVAFIIALVPAVDPNTPISSHPGYCLFDFTSVYAIFIIIYGLAQFLVVLVCFIVTTVALIRLLLRYRRVRSSNQASQKRRDSTSGTGVSRERGRSRSLVKKLSQMRLTAQEGLQLGIEARFLIMFATVVILFYISWLPIVVMLIYAHAIRNQAPIEDAIFWGIRLTVVSLAINPFLYGLLGGPYRKAYVYILRLLFSKCCHCVEPPPRTGYARTLWISKFNPQYNGDLSFSGSKPLPTNRSSELDISVGPLSSPRKLTYRASEPIINTAPQTNGSPQAMPPIKEHTAVKKTVTINIEATDMEECKTPLLKSSNGPATLALGSKLPAVYSNSPSFSNLQSHTQSSPAKRRHHSLPDLLSNIDSHAYPPLDTRHS